MKVYKVTLGPVFAPRDSFSNNLFVAQLCVLSVFSRVENILVGITRGLPSEDASTMLSMLDDSFSSSCFYQHGKYN